MVILRAKSETYESSWHYYFLKEDDPGGTGRRSATGVARVDVKKRSGLGKCTEDTRTVLELVFYVGGLRCTEVHF